MNRRLARIAAALLCTVWAGGAAAAEATDTDAPAATADKPLDSSGDLAAITKDLPGNIEGEIARAHLLRMKGGFADAAHALAELMLVAPDDPRVVGEYGKVMVQEGRPAEAADFLKRAIALSPNDWSLYSAEGVAYDQIDKHELARKAYEHALALNPGAPQILNNYAVSRMLAGDLDGAGHLLAQASAANSGNPKIAQNLAVLASMRPQAATPSQAVAPTPVAVAAPSPVSVAALEPAEPAATAAPRVLSSVVMEKVPVDPKAGRIASHAAMPHKLATAATAHKPKPVAAAPKPAALRTETAEAGLPALRTADGQ